VVNREFTGKLHQKQVISGSFEANRLDSVHSFNGLLAIPCSVREQGILEALSG